MIEAGTVGTPTPGTTAPAPESASSTPTPSTTSTTSSPDAGVQAMMAQALVDGGHWTPEQAAAALAGSDPDPSAQTPTENPFTSAVDQQNALTDMKSALAASGIEGADAMAAETIVRKGLANPPTPEQSAQAQRDTHQLLETLYGKEKAGWVIEWARREFQQLAAGNPKLVELADRSGAGNSMTLIQQLAFRGMSRYNRARYGGK